MGITATDMTHTEYKQGIDKVLALLDVRGELPRFDIAVETGVGPHYIANFLGELQKDHHIEKIQKKNKRGHDMSYYGLTPKGKARAKFINIEFPPPPEQPASEFGEPETKQPAPPKLETVIKQPDTTEIDMDITIPNELRGPKRIAIYEAIAMRPQSAQDLTNTLGISERAASSSLYLLKKSGFIKSRKPKGTEVSVTGKAYKDSATVWEIVKQKTTAESQPTSGIRVPPKVRGVKRIEAYKAIYTRAQSSGDLEHTLNTTRSAALNLVYMLSELKVIKKRKPLSGEVSVTGEPYPGKGFIYYASAKGAALDALGSVSQSTKEPTKKSAPRKQSGDWQSFVDNAEPSELIDMLMTVAGRMETEYKEFISMALAMGEAQKAMPDFIKKQMQG